MNENVIEWYGRAGKASVTAAPGTRLKNRLLELAEKYPDEVEVAAENGDGSVFAHVPVSFVTVRKPVERHMTEEQKKAGAERLAAYRLRKGRKDEEFGDDTEDLEDNAD